jgi:hypothetical protein
MRSSNLIYFTLVKTKLQHINISILELETQLKPEAKVKKSAKLSL